MLAVCGVPEHITGMVENDIEDHVDSGAVCVVDQGTKACYRPRVRVGFEEVLAPSPVIVLSSGALKQDRTYPQGSHSMPSQVADL